MKAGLTILFLVAAISLAAQEHIRQVLIGRDTCYIVIIQHKPVHAGIYFIHVHEDERASLKAGKRWVRKHGGTLITLKQRAARNLSFEKGDSTYIFDPNRIFSETGRDSTLYRLSSINMDAKEEIKSFADTFISLIDKPALVVALHNNTKGAPLSINTYTTAETAAIYVNPKMSEDDFVLTTSEKIFGFVRSRKINVVLQYAGNTIDDGSLSIYYSLSGVPYINVEAERGHYRQQRRILRKLKPLIRMYNK